MTTPNTQDSMAARKQSTSMKELPNFALTSSQDVPLDKRPTFSKQVGARYDYSFLKISSDSNFYSTSMENLSAPKYSKANEKEREKIEKVVLYFNRHLQRLGERETRQKD